MLAKIAAEKAFIVDVHVIGQVVALWGTLKQTPDHMGRASTSSPEPRFAPTFSVSHSKCSLKGASIAKSATSPSAPAKHADDGTGLSTRFTG